MNLSKIESVNDHGDGNGNNSQLLRDIEAISKALYLPKPPQKTLISPYDNRSKSAERTRFSESKSNQNLGILNENVLHKNKKSSLLWNWKKPLKALAHIGHHRFNICFFLHVHSIEGLVANFNDISLCVLWKRKDEVLQTRQSRVVQGNAKFEETLMHKCIVYGSRSGPHNSARYEVKLSLICASVVGALGIDIGKHWVDLTRLLPLTLEELEGEKSSGKWTTSFKLAGKAKGAILNVSFGFSVIKDNLVESKNTMNVFEPNSDNKMLSFEPNSDNKMLRRVGSVSSNLDRRSAISSTSLDAEVYEEVSPILELELSKSIKFLYEKLNEANLHGSGEFHLLSEHVESPNNLNFESAKDISESDYAEFVVIEQGIEMSEKEQLTLEQSSVHMIDGSVVEMINVDEIIKDESIALDDKMACNPKESTCVGYMEGEIVNDNQVKQSGVCPTLSTMDELESAFNGLLIPELSDLESPLAIDEFLEQENYMEVKSNYRASKMAKKSPSLDDATESVANDFLNMLGIEHTSFGLSSDGDPNSPRERLLREFEKEALASGNFNLGFESFDAGEDQVQIGCVSPTGSGSWNSYQDFGLFPDIDSSEKEHERAGQLLKNRWKANILENLETESLMKEWGLTEMAFQSSPRYCSDGFGSPVELPPEDSFELPALGDGFGPFVQTKDGGYLRSMNPSLFRNSKNVGSLIMQVSRAVVLPAEIGSEIIDILQYLASVGTKKLAVQAKKLLPLEDITGKTLQEVAQETTPITMVPKRQASPHHGSVFGQDSFVRRVEDEQFQFGWSGNVSSGLESVEMESGCVSLKDFASLAMGSIEALSIEGLRIQSSMSDVDAPSCIRTHTVRKNFEWKNTNFFGFLNSERAAGLQLPDVRDDANDVDELMDLSVTLDEWLKLDSGIISDDDHINERTFKILAAHHAKCIDLVGQTHGLLGNNLTVALMVLLRDPLRNYEPVGTSMLALLQIERVVLPFKPKMCSTMSVRNEEKDNEGSINGLSNQKNKEKEVEGTSWFKILEVHLAGLNTALNENQLWGTKTQQQSGTRWLLASGLAKSSKHPGSKSKAIVISCRQGTRKVQNEDVLWSITTNFHDTGSNWKELATLVPCIRNPDIVFPNDSTRSDVPCTF